jgi:hypothetical protein
MRRSKPEAGEPGVQQLRRTRAAKTSADARTAAQEQDAKLRIFSAATDLFRLCHLDLDQDAGDAAIKNVMGRVMTSRDPEAFLEALEKINKLRREGLALVQVDLSPDIAPPVDAIGDFKRWWLSGVVPLWNELNRSLRMCIDCGKTYAANDRRDRYCSKACRDRVASRGRQRVGSGKSAVENAVRRNEAWLKKHFQKCNTCKTGQWCPDREARLGSSDALNRRADVTAEEAEAILAAPRKRATGRKE